MKFFRTFAASLFAAAIVALASAGTDAAAQKRDMRVVSARAGGVNYVFGDVTYRRSGRDRWLSLNTATDLRDGDAVRTGATGLVEVLLNPGSYLRLGTDSEFVMTDGSLDGLRLRLVRGRAVVEATGYEGIPLMIKVDTPRAQAAIVRSGIYRFDAPAGGPVSIAVQKGRALVGRGEAATPLVVKGGNVARADVGVEVAKLDKRQRDELDQWSKERAEELAAANRKMTRQQANTLLAAYGYVSPQYPYSSVGVWYFDIRRNCYTFVPFVAGWQSPYGGYYGTMLWGQPMPCGPWGCRGTMGVGGATVAGGDASTGRTSVGNTSSRFPSAPAHTQREMPRSVDGSTGGFGGGPLRMKTNPNSEP